MTNNGVHVAKAAKLCKYISACKINEIINVTLCYFISSTVIIRIIR